MKTLLVLILLMSACDRPPTIQEEATRCAEDPGMKKMRDGFKAWGHTWCPVEIDIEIEEVDSNGNAICAYTDMCGKAWQIGWCSPSVGIRCVTWMKSYGYEYTAEIIVTKENP